MVLKNILINIMISKTIYMTYKELDKLEIYSKKWRELNPEYEIKLYDDEMCKKFLLEEYSQLHLDVFNYIKDGPIKCDFWRLCIINKYGGLYVDADINPLVSLKDYIEEDDYFVTCISYYCDLNNIIGQLNPHFILSDKNNEILEKCIDVYLQKYNDKIDYEYWGWSICYIMYIPEIKEKKSHILIKDGKKYKFLYEKSLNECEYNDVLVLHNRYENYINHEFV